jgi:hypothetical protein
MHLLSNKKLFKKFPENNIVRQCTYSAMTFKKIKIGRIFALWGQNNWALLVFLGVNSKKHSNFFRKIRQTFKTTKLGEKKPLLSNKKNHQQLFLNENN